jgi:hypothetical protein
LEFKGIWAIYTVCIQCSVHGWLEALT